MLIVSKFHDYYDCIQSMGIDKSIVYQRDKKIIKFKYSHRKGCYIDIPAFVNKADKIITQDIFSTRWSILDKSIIKNELNIHDLPRDIDIELYPLLVFFCGKIYVGFIIAKHYFRTSIALRSYEYYSDDIINCMFADQYQLVKRLCGNRSKNTIQSYINLNGTEIDMTEIKAPVALFDVFGILTINPCLSDIRFQREKDPYTAYQEISQYLSGVIGTGNIKEPWPISDDLKAQSKGYDKWSFRKKTHQRKGRRNG